MKLTTIITTAIAAGAIAIGAAGVAGASPAEDDALFLHFITSEGLTFESADVALAEGHAVCGVLDQGTSLSNTVDAVDQAMAVDHAGAVVVVAAAVVALCPWHDNTSSAAYAPEAGSSYTPSGSMGGGLGR